MSVGSYSGSNLLLPHQMKLLDDWWVSDRPDTPDSVQGNTSTAEASTLTQGQLYGKESKRAPFIWQSYNLPLPAALLEPQRWVGGPRLI